MGNISSFLLFVMMILFSYWFLFRMGVNSDDFTYKDFVQAVEKDQIESVVINQNKAVPTGKLEITFKSDEEGKRGEVEELVVSDVNEIQDILGIGRTSAYSLVKQKVFHSVRVGGSIRISKKSFDAWLDSQI